MRQDQLLTSMTISSISHISINFTELWRAISRRTPPSPPPTTKTCVLKLDMKTHVKREGINILHNRQTKVPIELTFDSLKLNKNNKKNLQKDMQWKPIPLRLLRADEMVCNGQIIKVRQHIDLSYKIMSVDCRSNKRTVYLPWNKKNRALKRMKERKDQRTKIS